MRRIEVDDRLEAYMEALLPERPAVLRRLEEHAEREGVPIVGPHEGLFLAILARSIGARRILELGTATGYSGLWLVDALPDARLTTIELDAARAEIARRAFADAGVADRVELIEEEAIGVLRGLDGPFDLVFNDLLNSFPDLLATEEAFEIAVRLLRPGGLLIADNALRRGEVLEPESQGARNVDRHNRLAAADPRLQAVIVPLRDGISIGVRLDAG